MLGISTKWITSGVPCRCQRYFSGSQGKHLQYAVAPLLWLVAHRRHCLIMKEECVIGVCVCVGGGGGRSNYIARWCIFYFCTESIHSARCVHRNICFIENDIIMHYCENQDAISQVTCSTTWTKI